MEKCLHIKAFWKNNDVRYCPQCDTTVAVKCERCDGGGQVCGYPLGSCKRRESSLKLVTCPECKGTGAIQRKG